MSDNDAYHNELIGGVGGAPWGDTLNHNNQKVSDITAWWGKEYGGADFTVLKGLRLKWDDGIERGVGHQDNSLEHRHFHFENGENIQDMTIHGAYHDPPGRADALEFTTTWGRPFFAGGNGGYAGRQNIGSGVLYGFDGAAGADIDSLGAVVQPVQPGW